MILRYVSDNEPIRAGRCLISKKVGVNYYSILSVYVRATEVNIKLDLFEPKGLCSSVLVAEGRAVSTTDEELLSMRMLYCYNSDRFRQLVHAKKTRRAIARIRIVSTHELCA